MVQLTTMCSLAMEDVSSVDRSESIGSGSTFCGLADGAFGQHAGEVDSLAGHSRALSVIGLAAALDAAAAAAIVSSLSGCPTIASAAAETSNGVGATAPIATRAQVTFPSPSSRSWVAALVTAMSILVAWDESAGTVRRSLQPEQGNAGRWQTRRRPARFRPGAVQKSSTATVRRPFGPAISTCASSTINDGMPSAAGEELHRLPPSEARPWIRSTTDQRGRVDQDRVVLCNRFIAVDLVARRRRAESSGCRRLHGRC